MSVVGAAALTILSTVARLGTIAPALVGLACAGSTDTARVGVLPDSSVAPALAATSGGPPTSHGRRIRVERFDEETVAAAALSDGSIDAVLGLSVGRALALSQSGQACLVGFLLSGERADGEPLSAIVTAADEVTDVLDLAAETVGVSSTETSRLVRAARSNGLVVGGSLEARLPELLQKAMQAGQLRAVAASGPVLWELREKGFRVVADNLGAAHIQSPFWTRVAAARCDFVAGATESFRQLARLVRDGVEFTRARPDDARRALARFFDLEVRPESITLPTFDTAPFGPGLRLGPAFLSFVADEGIDYEPDALERLLYSVR